MAWLEELVAAGREPVWAAIDHVDAAVVVVGSRGDVLERHGHGQVVAPVGVEVAHLERSSKYVLRLSAVARDPSRVLAPELVTLGCEPARAAVEHVHDADSGAGAGPLVGHTDRQVRVAVAVEVARRQGGAELVELLGVVPTQARRRLCQHAVAVGGEAPAGAVEEVDAAVTVVGPFGDVLEGDGHREVTMPVPVEVALCQLPPNWSPASAVPLTPGAASLMNWLEVNASASGSP